MLSENFVTSFNRTYLHEAGYQCDPDDRGNWTSGKVGVGFLKGTKYGVSAASYPSLDIVNLTREEAMVLYYKDFWLQIEGDSMPLLLAFQLFDATINHGMYHTTKMLQRAINTKDDAKFGPVSRAALSTTTMDDVILNFLSERLLFMTNVSTWPKYGKGWARRIAQNLRTASKDN